MGFNTCFNKSTDYITGVNLTSSENFNYRIVDKMTAMRMNVVDGIKLDQCEMVISINGRTDVKVGDYVLVLNKKYKVTEIGNLIKQALLKKRADLENIPGEKVLTLA